MLLILGCVIFVIVVVALLMFIVILGPSPQYRDGCIGQTYNALMDCPSFSFGFLFSAMCCISPARGRERWQQCSDHAINERNLFIVAFYILLVWPVEVLYLVVALPRLESTIASKCMSWFLVLISEYMYAKCVFTDPGTVTCGGEGSASLSAIEAARVRRDRRGQPDSGLRYRQGSEPPAVVSGTLNLGPETSWLGSSPSPAVCKKQQKQRVVVDCVTDMPNEANGVGAEMAVNDINSPVQAVLASLTNGSRTPELTSESEKEKRGVLSKPPLDRRLENALNSRYVVDGYLYLRAREESTVALGMRCTTCDRARPSRSKHCRLCNNCVRRFDHHCPWINNDVAEGTQRYFILFIFCHCISCTWAAIDMVRLIYQFLARVGALGWSIQLRNGKVIPLSLTDYILIIGNMQILAMTLLLFAVMIGLVLLVFGVYQMSFAISNVTLNESCKIEALVDTLTAQPSLMKVYNDAVAVRARLEAVAKRKPQALKKLRPPVSRSSSSEGSAGGAGTGTQQAGNQSGSGSKRSSKDADGAKEYANGTKKNREYRKKVRKMLITDLTGLYDRGALNNLKEVFFPYSVKVKR